MQNIGLKMFYWVIEIIKIFTKHHSINDVTIIIKNYGLNLLNRLLKSFSHPNRFRITKFRISNQLIAILFLLVFSMTPALSVGHEKPAIILFEASPSSVTSGENVTIKWNVSNASAILLNPGDIRLDIGGYPAGILRINGSTVVRPVNTTTYTILALNGFGNDTANTSVLVRDTVSPAIAQKKDIPVIVHFRTSPTTIRVGEAATLSWSVSNAAEVTISRLGKVALSGSTAVMPSDTATYTLTARNSGGEVTASVVITVQKPKLVEPVISNFSANPARITAGGTSILSWSVLDASSIIIDGIGRVGSSGSISVSPKTTTVFTLHASNAAGRSTATSRVEVVQKIQPPVINYFSIDKPSISTGDTARLSWSVSGASQVTIGGIGQVSSSGSMSVRPRTSTSYILSASNSGGTRSKSVFIEVGEASIQPINPVYPDMPEDIPILPFS